MSLKELYAVSRLLSTADPWPLDSHQRKAVIGLIYTESRAEVMSVDQLKALAELMIKTDHGALDPRTWRTLYDLLNREAIARGYEEWSEVLLPAPDGSGGMTVNSHQ